MRCPVCGRDSEVPEEIGPRLESVVRDIGLADCYEFTAAEHATVEAITDNGRARRAAVTR